MPDIKLFVPHEDASNRTKLYYYWENEIISGRMPSSTNLNDLSDFLMQTCVLTVDGELVGLNMFALAQLSGHIELVRPLFELLSTLDAQVRLPPHHLRLEENVYTSNHRDTVLNFLIKDIYLDKVPDMRVLSIFIEVHPTIFLDESKVIEREVGNLVAWNKTEQVKEFATKLIQELKSNSACKDQIPKLVDNLLSVVFKQAARRVDNQNLLIWAIKLHTNLLQLLEGEYSVYLLEYFKIAINVAARAGNLANAKFICTEAIKFMQQQRADGIEPGAPHELYFQALAGDSKAFIAEYQRTKVAPVIIPGCSLPSFRYLALSGDVESIIALVKHEPRLFVPAYLPENKYDDFPFGVNDNLCKAYPCWSAKFWLELERALLNGRVLLQQILGDIDIVCKGEDWDDREKGDPRTSPISEMLKLFMRARRDRANNIVISERNAYASLGAAILYAKVFGGNASMQTICTKYLNKKNSSAINQLRYALMNGLPLIITGDTRVKFDTLLQVFLDVLPQPKLTQSLDHIDPSILSKFLLNVIEHKNLTVAQTMRLWPIVKQYAEQWQAHNPKVKIIAFVKWLHANMDKMQLNTEQRSRIEVWSASMSRNNSFQRQATAIFCAAPWVRTPTLLHRLSISASEARKSLVATVGATFSTTEKSNSKPDLKV